MVGRALANVAPWAALAGLCALGRSGMSLSGLWEASWKKEKK